MSDNYDALEKFAVIVGIVYCVAVIVYGFASG